ncbi:hypothetical protein ABZ734_26665 [Streptomyces sp. NPDC006660]|uniref:hypothetical protein n=1 Tax=Streptomyces sp. NPDC006660 TaxID=3156901 RepID=UPI0033C9262E
MNHTRTATVIALAAAGPLLAGCSRSTPKADSLPATASPGTATVAVGTVDAAGAFKAITSTVKTAELIGIVTAENDSNHLLGRPVIRVSQLLTPAQAKEYDAAGSGLS